jgi:hypothetical protein
MADTNDCCERCGKKAGEMKEVPTRCESKVELIKEEVTEVKYCTHCKTWQCNICFGYADKNICSKCYFGGD